MMSFAKKMQIGGYYSSDGVDPEEVQLHQSSTNVSRLHCANKDDTLVHEGDHYTCGTEIRWKE